MSNSLELAKLAMLATRPIDPLAVSFAKPGAGR